MKLSKTRGESDALLAALEMPPEAIIPDGLPGRWWVAHTKPRTEKALARDLSTFGFHYYLPLRRKRTRSCNTGRHSNSIVPVFAGYLFFNGTEEQRYRALTTNRIANILAVTSQDRLSAELRQIHRVLRSGLDFRLYNEIHAGEWARVMAGPLAGAEGVVCGRLSRTRLVLNVEMLGQSVSVQVEADVLEPIEPPNYI